MANTGIRRWPSTRITERAGPRPRRPTCDRPLPPLLLAFERPLVKSTPVIRLRTSSTTRALVCWIWSWLTTEIGLGLVALVTPLIRDPVTISSPDEAGDACWANAWPAAASARPQMMEDAMRRPRVDLLFKFGPPSGRGVGRGLAALRSAVSREVVSSPGWRGPKDGPARRSTQVTGRRGDRAGTLHLSHITAES